MKIVSIKLKFTTVQMRDMAMRAAGLNPQAMSIKPGTRVEPRHSLAHKRSHVKHKGYAWE